MPRTVKIAISLPQELLQGIERERRATGETRSQFFRRSVKALLGSKRELEEQYIRGYRQHPETEEEIALAESTARRSLVENPWDEGAEE